MRFSGFRQLLSHWAERTPEAPALRYGEVRRTYGELREAVDARAAALAAEGLTCLGVLSDGSLDCVVEIFAAVLAGRQVVLLDENLPDEALRGLIRYTDIDSLWGDPELTEELTPSLTEGGSGAAGQLLFFTSGTTEQAKAVVLTDESLCASAWNGGQMLPLTPEDTLLCMLPLGHVFGFVCGLLWGLSSGACVALGRGARHYFDDCAYYKPTAVSLVPMLLGYLLRQNALDPELDLILIGAGDCPPELLAAAADRGVRVAFGYGLTETSSGVAISVSGDPFAMAVCPDDAVTIAEDGEVLVSAPTCMMRGYWRRAADTADVLRDGILHTGDLGYLDGDGRLHITGRKKDILVLSDGTKIFLPEYEAAIMAALEHQELAVTLKNGRPALIYSGEGDPSVIRGKLRPVMEGRPRGQQLAEILIVDEPLPRTATGKIKRWELQQKAGNLS